MQYVRLLQENREFAKLWASQVVSLIGDWFSLVALAALIAAYTRGTDYEGFAVSGYLLARLIPPVIVSFFGGVLIDRFNRKWIMAASDVGRGIVVLLLLFANDPSLLWLIYLLTILQFGLSAVFEPARNAIMPSLLRPEDLVLGNTLSSVTWSVMLAAGAILGGVVASAFGITVALIVDALTFFISGLIVMQINPTYAPKAKHDDEVNEDRSFWEGIRYLRQRPQAQAAIIVKTINHIGSIDTIMILLATSMFVVGTDGTISLAVLWFAFGIGAILGPFVLNRFTDNSPSSLRRLIIIGFVTVTIGWLAVGFAPNLWLLALAVGVRAIGGSINWTYSSVLVQKCVDDEYLGRMFSLDMMGFQLFSGISVLVTGLVIDSVGTEFLQQIAIGTGILTIPSLLLWVWVVHRLDGLQDPKPRLKEEVV